MPFCHLSRAATVLFLVATLSVHAARPGHIIRFGLTTPETIIAPEITDAIDVAVVDYGGDHGAVLRADGSVSGWSAFAPVPPPTGLRDVIKIDGGNPIMIALRRDGTVVTWPAVTVNGHSFQPPLGLSDVVDVGAGYSSCFALKRDGAVVGWGELGIVPAGLVDVQALAIGKAGYHLALKRDGTVVGWMAGNWGFSAPTIPATAREVASLSAGYSHGLALKRDGTVVGWGTSSAAQVPAGLTDVIQVLAVQDQSYALRRDGSVVAWGVGAFNSRPVIPEGFVGARRLAAGRNNVVAIVGPRHLDTAQAITIAAGYDVTLGAGSNRGATATFQWRHNGVPLPDARGATLTLAAVQPRTAGIYDVLVTEHGGPQTSAAATLAVTTGNGASSFLSNLSTRGRIDAERPLIVGFVLSPGASARELYLRGVGPGLSTLGITGAAPDPVLNIHQGDRVIGSNDNWVARSPAGATFPDEDFHRVGGFALTRDSRDAALRAGFLPAGYSAVVSAADGRGGVVLAECYDYTFVGEYSQLPYGGRITGRLINLSSRGDVATGEDVLVAGFVLVGPGPQRLLIRGIGPSLSRFGVAGAVPAPRLRLYRGTELLLENSGWDQADDAVEVAAVSASVGAFPLSAGARDTALLVHLQPGNYTAEVAAAGAAGVGLIEIYEADR